MHDFESRGRALRAILRRAPQALVLIAVMNTAGAQDAAGADATSARRVNINEYIVRGNTVLEARDIERAV